MASHGPHPPPHGTLVAQKFAHPCWACPRAHSSQVCRGGRRQLKQHFLPACPASFLAAPPRGIRQRRTERRWLGAEGRWACVEVATLVVKALQSRAFSAVPAPAQAAFRKRGAQAAHLLAPGALALSRSAHAEREDVGVTFPRLLICSPAVPGFSCFARGQPFLSPGSEQEALKSGAR